MEQRITVNGKTYIVPAQNINGLIQWLEQNGVDTTKTQQVREVAPPNTDERNLLLENSI